MKKIKTIGLVAPSGAIRDLEAVNKKIEVLSKNYKIKKFYNEKASFGCLADTDNLRAKFFEEAFKDDEVDLVVSIRGGYGALRIVDKINYEVIKDKIYLGSSDATILLCALNKKTNVKCFHGLMITNGFVENVEKNIEIIEQDIFNLNLEPINGGSASGALWGGNLSSLVSLFSAEAFLPEGDIILFVEDLNEPMYKIDKMMFEIFRCEKLKSKIKGIIFGDFYLEREEIMPLIKDFSALFSVPCFLTNDITHKENNITLPFGKVIELS